MKRRAVPHPVLAHGGQVDHYRRGNLHHVEEVVASRSGGYGSASALGTFAPRTSAATARRDARSMRLKISSAAPRSVMRLTMPRALVAIKDGRR
jgi:hypothetical protein